MYLKKNTELMLLYLSVLMTWNHAVPSAMGLPEVAGRTSYSSYLNDLGLFFNELLAVTAPALNCVT